nr:MAG TPA: hypothetical protein [Caudoviricetes sp.]
MTTTLSISLGFKSTYFHHISSPVKCNFLQSLILFSNKLCCTSANDYENNHQSFDWWLLTGQITA